MWQESDKNATIGTKASVVIIEGVSVVEAESYMKDFQITWNYWKEQKTIPGIMRMKKIQYSTKSSSF